MNKIYQLLLVGMAALLPSAYGQGFYTTYQLDGTDFLQTDAIGYPGSGACGSLSMWNSLNGDYVSGWAPADLMSGTYGNDSTDYYWQYGYSYSYQSPYGYCIAASFTVSNWLGFGFTTSRTPYQSYSGILPGRSGPRCVQTTDALSCSNTSNPRYPVTSVVVGAVGLLCAEFYNTIIFRLGFIPSFGPSTEVYGPGYCSPVY